MSLLERRVDWSADGFHGFAVDVTLRSGVRLVVSETRATHFVRLDSRSEPAGLLFVLSRGTGVTMTVGGDDSYLSGAGALEVNRIRSAIDSVSEITPGAHNEYLVLHCPAALLRELLKMDELPRAIRDVSASPAAFCRSAVPMTVPLFTLLDELHHSAAEGAVRQLYLEGKALEVLARVVEAFEQDAAGQRALVAREDVASLHRVKERLLEPLDETPSLSELCKEAGFSETKLKQSFRRLFGLPPYAYLRERRLSLAHEWLRQGKCSVTEAASRVGYANASKFAHAFRKRFGISPSSLRRHAEDSSPP